MDAFINQFYFQKLKNSFLKISRKEQRKPTGSQ